MSSARDDFSEDKDNMIIYFTGTGNSRHAAQKLAEAVKEESVIDMGKMIKDGERGKFFSETPYIFVLPTYGWRIPKIAEDFIRNSIFEGDERAYFILTCGDSCGNAGTYAEKLCDFKNLKFMGCAGIKMPENYIAMFSVPDEKTSETLIRRGDEKVLMLAKSILDGKCLPTKKSFAGAVESAVVNPVFYALIVKAKGFRSTRACVGCGLCAEVCVMNNISISGGKPVWNDRCTHCMACICRCPEEAIEYKRRSEGKRRYYLED